MKIVIDARPLSHPQAGGFRSYVRALLRGLSERVTSGTTVTKDFELLLYVDRELTAEDRAFVPPGARVRVLAPNRLKTDLLRFPGAVRADRPDLVQGTMNYLPRLGATHTVLTIHDAIGVKQYPWDMAVPRTPRERFVNRYWAVMTRLSARAARRVITDSHGAAAELAEALRLPKERLTVIYPGVLPAASPDPNDGYFRSNTVLAIASPDPRKNIDLLYRALGQEGRQFPNGAAPRLDLVCSSDAAARRAEAAIAARGVRGARLLRGVDDTLLRTLYASVGVFTWPSLREGFGLPPLEAMSCGCPVAASRAPAMPEVLGDSVVYFDPNDPAELAVVLARLLNEPAAARQARVQAGRERTKRFTCRRMAEETVAVWKALGAGRS